MSLSLLATSISSTTTSNPFCNTKVRLRPWRIAYTSCEQKQFKEGGDNSHVIDRRNVLLGLGGLYGATAATLGNRGMVAMGAPVQPPDPSQCHFAVDLNTGEEVNCCPPYSTTNFTDFVPPSYKEPLRVRRAAHKLDPEYVAKFKEAIAKMKALPEDDPWSFKQQSTIHCTYCNGSFNQVGFDPPVVLQVHGSWLFLPWHRLYLYFFERILGKLIGDPTFALPYWNWDTPQGMRMPQIYLDISSPLYNDKRDHSHFQALMNYKYAYGDANPSPAEEKDVIVHNLRDVYNLFKESFGNPELFMGLPLRAGETMPANVFGGCETIHNTIHQWTGPSLSPYHDMGNFSTAARDTIFYAHHANVDRMWDIYSSFRGYRPEFKDPDFLDAAFLFYDENRRVVKCKVKNCLNSQQLRYSYQPENLPWINIRRKYKQLKATNKRLMATESVSLMPATEFGSESRPLTEPIRALVQRPKTSRSKDEKEDEVEVLVVEGIEVSHASAARFDVYVTKPIEDLVGPDKGEFAGSFVKIPHGNHKTLAAGRKSSLHLGITTLLEDIEAETSDKLVVTIVPRMGEVVVGGVNVKLSKVDEP